MAATQLLLVILTVALVQSEQDPYHPRFARSVSSEDQHDHHHDNHRDWNKIAKDDLQASLQNLAKINDAKNVILFIGDGMGVSTVTAARHYYRQSRDLHPADATFTWDHFPVTGLSMTYNVDRITPDSAATASAFLCGEKAKYGTLGVNQNVERGNCSNIEGNKLRSAWKHAMDEGKAVGIVTTTRITHATPAAAYASVPDRDYEEGVDDDAVDGENCQDIAYQLIHDEDNENIQVILGGGRLRFIPISETDDQSGEDGMRPDNITLIEDWQDNMDSKGRCYKYVDNKEDFDAVDPEEVDYLFGLLATGHLAYELDRDEEEEPSLSEMVDKAIRILSRNEKGFFLLVEGGRIDHAHHDNLPKKSLEDVIAMNKAVDTSLQLTNEEDTLTVISADHSHVFTLAGYPKWNDNVLGILYNEAEVEDGKPYQIVGYTNGPGYQIHRDDNGTDVPRMDLTDVNTTVDDFVADAGIPIKWESHGGEEVAIYAKGPMSYLFMGTHEQHYIAHAMMYASCVGPNKDNCPPSASTSLTPSTITSLMATILICVLGKFAA